MQWVEVISSARYLLQTIPRFGYGATINPDALFTIANQDGSPELPRHEDQRRHLFQAIDLLSIEGLIMRSPGGVAVTPFGEQVLAQGTGSWEPDPSSETLREWIEIEDLVADIDQRRSTSDVTVSRLSITDWRQFDAVDILFHPRLTILTGANAAGKTTLLSVLAPLLNWSAPLVTRGTKRANSDQQVSDIGLLQFSNGARAGLYQSVVDGVNTTSVGMSHAEPIDGIFITSHRSISSYRQLENLPAQFSTSNVLLQQFAAEIQTRYSGGSSQYPPLYRMKQALVSAALFGYGNPVVQPAPEALEVWEGFQGVLTRFLPRTLGFQKLLVDNGEVIIETESGSFPIEAASGGLSAMLELAWQIFLRGRGSDAFTVCIDEPENHLHPELQRTIIPALLDAFPKATFVVATHSPFVVTSTPDCSVYALARFDGEKRVTSRRVDNFDASWTANDTLQSILGLETPLAVWAETELRNAVLTLPEEPNSADLLNLRHKLRSMGLERQFPAAVAAIGEADLDPAS